MFNIIPKGGYDKSSVGGSLKTEYRYGANEGWSIINRENRKQVMAAMITTGRYCYDDATFYDDCIHNLKPWVKVV